MSTPPCRAGSFLQPWTLPQPPLSCSSSSEKASFCPSRGQAAPYACQPPAGISCPRRALSLPGEAAPRAQPAPSPSSTTSTDNLPLCCPVTAFLKENKYTNCRANKAGIFHQSPIQKGPLSSRKPRAPSRKS